MASFELVTQTSSLMKPRTLSLAVVLVPIMVAAKNKADLDGDIQFFKEAFGDGNDGFLVVLELVTTHGAKQASDPAIDPISDPKMYSAEEEKLQAYDTHYSDSFDELTPEELSDSEESFEVVNSQDKESEDNQHEEEEQEDEDEDEEENLEFEESLTSDKPDDDTEASAEQKPSSPRKTTDEEESITNEEEIVTEEEENDGEESPPAATKPAHFGLKEVSAMKPDFHRPSSKLRRPKYQNDYRDPDAIEDILDAENELNPAEAAKKAFDKSRFGSGSQTENNAKEEHLLPEKANEIKNPEIDVDYITNYVEDGGFIHPPTYDVVRPKKSLKKKTKTLDQELEDMSSENDEKNYDDFLRSTIAADPSLERSPFEDTASYFKRVYPKMKNLMEGSSGKNKSRSKKGRLPSIPRIFAYLTGTPFKKTKPSQSHSLVLKDMFNRTRYTHSNAAENNGVLLQPCSSTVGAVSALLFLLA